MSDKISNNFVERITVVVRKRPLTPEEAEKNVKDVVGTSSNCVVVFEPKQKLDLTKYIKESKFLFDHVFSHEDDNLRVYDTICRPLIDKFFLGNKVTFFAYGQTGSGKTYTMMGEQQEEGTFGMPRDYHNTGIYDLAVNDILKNLANSDYKLEVSFYEIYCNKLYDLLNGRAELELLEDAKRIMNVKGLNYFEVKDHSELQTLIAQGMYNRVTDQNGVNRQSSRSHSVLEFKLMDSSNKLASKMSFIDLAGSEKGSDVIDMGKQTKFDGAEINKSLLALKECIRALDADKNYVNYRQSKLTLVLRECFIGQNCYTTMITQISPTERHTTETINTLRYASKIKNCNASKKPKELINNSNPYEDVTSSDTEVYGKLEESSARRSDSKMKFKYKPKTKYSRENGSNSSSSLEVKRVSGIGNNKNKDNKENVREITNFERESRISNTSIGNLSKLSTGGTSMESKVPSTSNPHPLKKPSLNNAKKEVSHIKNISMDNANALDHNVLEYLDNKLIGGPDPSPEKPKNISNKHRSEKNATPRDKIVKGRSNTHYDMFYDKKEEKSSYFNDGYVDQFEEVTNIVNSHTTLNNRKRVPHTHNHAKEKEKDKENHPDHYNGNNLNQLNESWESGKDLHALKHSHESLIDRVLQLEEEILHEHKVYIDHKVDMVKKYMSLYTENEQPESNIYNYVDNLDALLNDEVAKINDIKNKLNSFKTDLKAEREMSDYFKKINFNPKEDIKN